MPGFSGKPNFESSQGEKSEKQEKADLDDEAIGDVPEGVLEAKDVELKEVENEEWPKEYEITVEIDGEQVEIPVKETKVEFPDYIVEDTGGVTGYIRKEVRWDDFDNAFPASEYAESGEYFDTLNELKRRVALYTHPSDIKRGGLEDRLELHRFPEAKERYEEWKRKKQKDKISKKDKEKYKQEKEKRKKYRKEKKKLEEKLRSTLFYYDGLIDELTDYDFPANTANHVMSSAGGIAESAEKMKKEGVTLQKVFDPKTLTKHLKAGDEITLHSLTGLKIRSTATNKNITNISDEEKPEELTNLPYGGKLDFRAIQNSGTEQDIQSLIKALEYCSKNDDFYLTSDRGLSVSPKNKGYWWPTLVKQGRPALDDIAFGFSTKNEAFENYLQKSSLVEKKISKDGRVSTSTKHFLSDVGNYGGHEYDHPYVAAFNGHPDIPDLRWCHASYAYIPTERGFNVLEFTSEDIESEDENEIPEEVDANG